MSNREVSRFEFWPTDYTLNAPLGVAVLIGAGVGFLVGALVVWFDAVAARMRARRAENRVRLLEAQVKELQARIAPAALPPPMS